MPTNPTFTITVKAAMGDLNKLNARLNSVSQTFKKVSTDFKAVNTQMRSALNETVKATNKIVTQVTNASNKIVSVQTKNLQKITTVAKNEAKRLGDSVTTQVKRIGDAYKKMRQDVATAQGDISSSAKQIKSLAAQMGKDTAKFGGKLNDAMDRIEKKLNEALKAIKQMSTAAKSASDSAAKAVQNLGKVSAQTSKTNRQMLKEELKAYQQHQAALSRLITGPATGQTSFRGFFQDRRLFNQMLQQAQAGAMVNVGERPDVQTGKMVTQQMRIPIGVVKSMDLVKQNGEVAFSRMINSAEAASIKMGQMRQPLIALGTHIATVGKNAQWTGRQLMMGLTMPVVLAVRKTRDLFLSVSGEYTRMEKIISSGKKDNAFQKALPGIKSEIYDSVKMFGISQKAVAALTADMVAMGYGVEQVGKKFGSQAGRMAKEILYTATLGDIGISTAKDFYRTMMKVFVEPNVNGFNAQIKGTNFIVDQLNQIENKTAINLNQLADAMPIAASAAKLFGLNAAELASILTGLYDKGITNVMTGATSLQFILTRVLAPTEKARVLFNETFGAGALESIQKLGSGLDRLIALSELYQKLYAGGKGAVQTTQVFSELIQKRQIKSFGPLMQSIDTGIKQVRLAVQNSGTAMAEFASRGIDPATASFSEFKKVIADPDIRKSLLASGVLTEGFARALVASSGAIDISMNSMEAMGQSIEDLAKQMRALSVQEIEIKIQSPTVRYQVLVQTFKMIGAEIGEALFPSLIKLMSAVASMFETINKLSPKIKAFAGAVALAAASLGPLVYIIGTFTTASGLLLGSLARLLPGLQLLDKQTALLLSQAGKLPANLIRWGKEYVVVGSEASKVAKALRALGLAKEADIAVTQTATAANTALAGSLTAVNTATAAGGGAAAAGGGAAAAGGGAAAAGGGSSAAINAAVLGMGPLKRLGQYIKARQLPLNFKDRKAGLTEIFKRRASMPVTAGDIASGVSSGQITSSAVNTALAGGQGGYVQAIAQQMQQAHGNLPPANRMNAPDLTASKIGADYTTLPANIPARTRFMQAFGIKRGLPGSPTVTGGNVRATQLVQAPYTKFSAATTGVTKNAFQVAASPLVGAFMTIKAAALFAASSLTNFGKKMYSKMFGASWDKGTGNTFTKKFVQAMTSGSQKVKTSILNFGSSISQAAKFSIGKHLAKTGKASLFGHIAEGFKTGGAKGGLLSILSPKTLMGGLVGMRGASAGAAAGGAEAVSGVGGMLAGGGGALASVGAIAGVLAVALPLIIAIVVFVKKLMENWDKVSAAFQGGIKAIKQAWAGLMKEFKAIGKIFSDAFKDVNSTSEEGGKVKTIWQSIGEAISRVMTVVSVLIKIIAGAVKLLAPIFRWFAKIVVSNMNGFIALFQTIAKLFKGDVKGAIKEFLAFLLYVAQYIISIASPVLGLFSLLAKGFFKFVSLILNALDRITPDIGPFKWIKTAKDKLEGLSKSFDLEKMLRSSIDKGLAAVGKKTVKAPVEFEEAKVKRISAVTTAPTVDSELPAGGGDGAGKAADSIWDNFLSALKSKLQEFISELREAVNKSFEEVWSKRLKVYDDQIKAIDDLEKKEQELLATQEYIESRREALNKRSLDRQNYVRNRALAIYEGRIDDARTLDLEFSQTDKENNKSIRDLDQKRSQELVKKQREAQKESINVAKQAAEERKKIEEEALKNMLDDITKYTPKNAAEWENMMNSINNVLTNYGIPRIVGAWTDGMSMFQRAVDEVTQDLVQDSFWQGEWIDTSIYQWINRMFGVPLQSLIKAMKEVGSQAGAAGGAAATSAFDSNFNPAGTEDQLPGATGEPGKEVDTGMRQTEHYGSFMKQDVGRYRAMVQFIRGSKYNPEVVMKALSDTGFAAWLKGAKTQRTMNAKDVGKLGLGLPALPVSEAYIDIIRRSGINPESPIPVSTGPAGPAGPGKTSQLMPRAERDAQRRGRFLGRYQTAGANQDRAKQMLAALRSPILPEEKRMREQYDTWREKQRKEGKNDSMVAFLREGLRNKDNRLPAPPKGMKYDRNGNLVVREGFIPVYDEQGNLIGYDKATGRGGRGNQTPTTTTTQPKPTTTTQPKPTTTTNAPTTTTTTPKPPRLGRAIRMGMMNAVSKGIQPRPGSTPDFSDTKAGDDIPDGFYPDGGSAYLGKDGKWTRKKPSVVREQRDARRGRTQGGVGVRGRYPTNTAPIKFPKPITAKEVNDALANPQSLRGSTGAGTRHGKNFADGVKQGITNNTKGLRSPLLNMVDFMDTTTGTGMEARSPSRRAAKFGRFWASGIAMGLLSDDSVETLRKAINGLINPFLDLTRSGRLKINFEVATGGIESGLKKRLDEILGGDFIFNKGGFKDLTDFLKRMASYMGGLLDALDKLSGFKGDFKKGPIAKGYGDAMKSIGLASGGIVKRRTGGIMANIGEGRYDEAVIPLPRGIDSFLNSFQPARASMSSFEGSMKVAMTAALKECAPYMGGQSGGQDINIYVDNFIGQPQWFESMMSEYGVKVAPNKQRSYGTINRRVTSYQDNNYRTGRI